MAWDINRVVLVGRVANPVDMRHTPSGAAVARFGVAVGGRPRPDGTDSVSFFNVVTWNKLAENCNTYLTKGLRIAIDGRLEQNSWTAQDGSKRSAVEIIAERVEFLSPPNSQQETQSHSPYAAQSSSTYATPDASSRGAHPPKPSHTPPFGEDFYDNSFDDTPLDDMSGHPPF